MSRLCALAARVATTVAESNGAAAGSGATVVLEGIGIDMRTAQGLAKLEFSIRMRRRHIPEATYGHVRDAPRFDALTRGHRIDPSRARFDDHCLEPVERLQYSREPYMPRLFYFYFNPAGTVVRFDTGANPEVLTGK